MTGSFKLILLGNPMITIIAAYVPTDMKEELSEQYLLRAIKSEPPRNIIIVLGNFNTSLEDENHKTNPQVINSYRDKTNDNGKRLVSMC